LFIYMVLPDMSYNRTMPVWYHNPWPNIRPSPLAVS
jgi:hypothetical protein